MQNLIWCFNMVRCAFKWIQYELICTPVHLNAHVSYHFHIIFTLVGCFTISLHLQDLNPSKHNQHHLKRKSRPYSWCFSFFLKWSIVVTLGYGTWRSFENDKNVDFHHVLTHWKFWYFSWDLRWLKFRTRTFKKCKWFVFKFIYCCFIIVNCQVIMRKGHKNADVVRCEPMWSNAVWYAHFLLQYGEFFVQHSESHERSIRPEQ